MIALGMKGDEGFFENILFGIREGLAWFGESGDSFGFEAKLERGKGDNDEKSFSKDVSLFDGFADEIFVAFDEDFELFVFDLGDLGTDLVQVLGDVFLLGADEDLDAEAEGIYKAGKGGNDCFLLTL